MELLTDEELMRGGRVMMYTSLERADLFTWLDGLDTHGCPTLVDTWQFPHHPAPDGSTFTLYAVTVVVLPRANELLNTMLDAAQTIRIQQVQATAQWEQHYKEKSDEAWSALNKAHRALVRGR